MAEREEPSETEAAPADLRQIVAQFAAPLYRYAFRLSGCAADAEDLVQQTFLVAQTKRDQLREPERLSSWLFAVLRHTWCKIHRRRKLAGHSLAGPELDGLPAPEDESPLDSEALQKSLNDLPDEFRVILLMFYFEELSYQEIATQLEIPIGTVMSRLSRAKGHLRRLLEAPPSVERRPILAANYHAPSYSPHLAR